MRLPAALLMIAAMLLGSTAQAKPEPVVSLPLTSKWVVKYDDNSCRLFGQFGDEAEGITFMLTRYQPGDPFDLIFYGKPLTAKGRDVDLTLDFGLPGGPVKRDALAGRGGKLPFLMISHHRIDGRLGDGKSVLPPITVAQEAAATSLTIGYRGKQYRLETGRLDRPFAKLRECQTDLVKFWGYDPIEQAELSCPPIPRGYPGNWARSDDFPASMLANGRSGLVKFRLDISAAGAVTNCVVLEQTSPADFGRSSCKILLLRAKFDPARDKDGKPVRSFWVSSIRWLA